MLAFRRGPTFAVANAPQLREDRRLVRLNQLIADLVFPSAGRGVRSIEDLLRFRFHGNNVSLAVTRPSSVVTNSNRRKTLTYSLIVVGP